MITLPESRYYLGRVHVECECGRSVSAYDGVMSAHFPVFHGGVRLRDPFAAGTSACRYSGRTVTLDAAVDRDNQLTRDERRVKRWAA
ncbi:hypothetical protein ACFWW5_00715 [Streptomyces albidoflavus]